MCVGFNCKNSNFPISILTKVLLHDKDQETVKECQHYYIPVIDGKAELSKSVFNNEIDEVSHFIFFTNYFCRLHFIHSSLSMSIKITNLRFANLIEMLVFLY